MSIEIPCISANFKIRSGFTSVKNVAMWTVHVSPFPEARLLASAAAVMDLTAALGSRAQRSRAAAFFATMCN
jgi:hypothetical protein